MNYRFEYNGNPEFVTLHVTIKICDDTFISSHFFSDESKQNVLLNLMMGALGITEVSIRPYSITMQRGAAFDRGNVLQTALETFLMYAKLNNLLEEGEEIKQLPTLRSDIRVIMCKDCLEEQEREMRRSMRDFDTLEY